MSPTAQKSIPDRKEEKTESRSYSKISVLENQKMVPLLDRSRNSLDTITVRHIAMQWPYVTTDISGWLLVTLAAWCLQFVLLPFRNIARHGEVKRISGLISEETQGVLKVFLESAI